MGFHFFFKSLCCTCTCVAGPDVGLDAASSRFGAERSFLQTGFARANATGTSFNSQRFVGQDAVDAQDATELGTVKSPTSLLDPEKLAPPPYSRPQSDGSSVWPQGTGQTEKSVMPWRVDTPVLSSPVDSEDRKLAFGRYKYDAADEGEVSFACGERLEVLNDAEDWWFVRKMDGTEGAAPSNYLSVVPDFLLKTKLTARVVSSYAPTEALSDGTSSSASSSAGSSDVVRVSVAEGEIVDILDNLDHTEWNVRKSDGTSGCVPMEHLKICPEDLTRAKIELQVKTLFTYPSSDSAASLSPSELAFTQGEILDILYRAPTWWLGRNSDGKVGIVPSNFLSVL